MDLELATFFLLFILFGAIAVVLLLPQTVGLRAPASFLAQLLVHSRHMGVLRSIYSAVKRNTPSKRSPLPNETYKVIYHGRDALV